MVLLGLGLLGSSGFGAGGWRWLVVDVTWSMIGGLIIGGTLGTAIGKLVLYLRTRHREAVGLNEFLALGLVAIAYGVAQLCQASGFLAVFAAGLALQRIQSLSVAAAQAGGMAGKRARVADDTGELATHSDHAGTYLMDAVQGFNGQLERLAEVAVVMVTGAMLSYAPETPLAIAFALLLFFVARPVAVWCGLIGATGISRDQRWLISWFGIRGVGSIFYVMHAINNGLPRQLGEQLLAITLTTVATSIVLHGISVTPLMALYARRRRRRR